MAMTKLFLRMRKEFASLSHWDDREFFFDLLETDKIADSMAVGPPTR